MCYVIITGSLTIIGPPESHIISSSVVPILGFAYNSDTDIIGN